MLIVALALAAQPAPYFDDLGSWHREITTSSPDAQRYFDQGLRLVYAFNHDEAVRSFRWARTLDPACAMCAWGAAYALGPNINAPPMPERLAEAQQEVNEAVRLSGNASDVERALIGALSERYGSPYTVEAQKARDVAYAEAMRDVAEAYPDDPDVATLYAESLMDLRPWDYWTAEGEPNPGTEEMVAALEGAIARWPDHPGANHYYVHAMEASPEPGKAIDAAWRVGGLMPGAGHLVHMPAHIWLRIGRYWDAAEANRRAIAADEDYYEQGGLTTSYPMYTAHNWMFLAQAEMYLGDADAAVDAARAAADAMPLDVLRMMPGWNGVLAGPALMLARFGRWDEVLAEPLPPDEFAYALAMAHYARGVALAETGDAAPELAALRAIRARIPADAPQGQNTSVALLDVAETVLEARIAVAEGRLDEGIAAFEEAIALEDALRYDEPSDWPWPVRHDLAKALTDAGRVEEAEAVWAEELEKHPDDPWAVAALGRVCWR